MHFYNISLSVLRIAMVFKLYYYCAINTAISDLNVLISYIVLCIIQEAF